MRQVGRLTPQRKIIGVNDKFGNRGIKRQQGTTRIIFDSLPLDGRETFRFFEGSNNRDFPFTNMGSSGNQLGVGEALAFERAYLLVVQDDPIFGAPIISPLTITSFGGILAGDINLEIANTQVLKPIPLASFAPEFNKNAYFTTYTNFEFDTQIVLPPLLEFVSTVRAVRQPEIADAFLRLTFEGVGSIIAPRRTF